MTSQTPDTVGALMAQSGVVFGTSGARGLVSAMTDRVCHGYTAGFLRHLASLGEFTPGTRVALAGDLRPSTPQILAACAQAVRDLGGQPVNCGLVPTPTLAFYAFGEAIPSLMVTGSHIPADRNGIKFYRPHGEVLKADEAGMMVQRVEIEGCGFALDGALLAIEQLAPPVAIEAAYLARYRQFFGADALQGQRIGIYQHSAVGRDLLVDIFAALGAEVIALGRSDTFVPVDTEAVRPEDIRLAREWAAKYRLDAIVSTDGDSDRPLVADETGAWLRGDVLGVICARQLGADCVVTPVSSNTMLEGSGSFAHTARTRIGSPYVIAEMVAQLANGGKRVCGYEANGGFLLASDIVAGKAVLRALPTRDAMLPAIAALVAAQKTGLTALLCQLPQRVTFSDRIAPFLTATSQTILENLGSGDLAAGLAQATAAFGNLAGNAAAIDHTDGLRITFANGEIIHLRPSGNAPELRCYTEADSADRAEYLTDGALRIVRDVLAAALRR